MTDTIFVIGDKSVCSDAHLRLALKSDSGLVRRHAKQEIELRRQTKEKMEERECILGRKPLTHIGSQSI
jgi:hypothetical protein